MDEVEYLSALHTAYEGINPECKNCPNTLSFDEFIAGCAECQECQISAVEVLRGIMRASGSHTME